ncbi:ROK family protein [Patescibacteria group bacterium]|nr:ROK family protein [Patescibacteria group bacterium]MBU0879579.1 ROK family protein [Patescibacteria group bacterium]MBU1783584.1 ROK family protein [Patescibacteria group bacterium]
MASDNNKNYSIGIDIGGTKMSAVLFDGADILAEYMLTTPKDTFEHFMIMLNALIEPLLDKARQNKIIINGIGIGVAGVLDYQEGRVLNSPNIPLLNDQRLTVYLEAKLGLSIKVDNDVNCFTRAEVKIGAGKKYKNIFGITIGTGIGGAWWFNNEIYLGAHGGAGESGWMVVDYQNGIRLEDAYHKLAQNNPASMAEEAYRGDVLAEKSYQEFGQYLGITLANIVNIIDPEVIILGGGVVESSDLFLSVTKKSMRQYIMSPDSKVIKIIKSKLGEKAGAIGAAMLF